MKWNSKVKLRPLQCCQPLWNHVPGDDNDGWCWGHVEAEWNLKKNAQLCLPSIWMWIFCSMLYGPTNTGSYVKVTGIVVDLGVHDAPDLHLGLHWQRRLLDPSKTFEADFQMHPESNHFCHNSIIYHYIIFIPFFFQFLPNSTTNFWFPKTKTSLPFLSGNPCPSTWPCPTASSGAGRSR